MKTLGSVLLAIILALLIAPTANADDYIINGKTYVAITPGETLTATFTRPDGGITLRSYHDYVLLHVTGTGQSYTTDYNDAFYLYADGNGNPIGPWNGHDGGFYQLAFSTTTLTAFDLSNNAENSIYGGVPSYNTQHDYTFVLDTGTTKPSTLHFGVSDGGFSDNTGAYHITVSQLLRVVPAFDLNQDGKPDLLWQNRVNGSLAYWLMVDETRKATGTIPPPASGNWSVVGTPALNGDSQPDILWQNNKTGVVIYSYLQGEKIVGGGTLRNTGLPWKVVGTPDLNADGQPDILFQNQKTGEVRFWLMDGVHPIGGGFIAIPPAGWNLVASADLRQSGSADLIFQDLQSGNVSYYEMQGVRWTGKTGTLLQNVPTGWTVVGAADIEGGDHPGIYLQNTALGKLAYYPLDGTTWKGQIIPLARNISSDWLLVAPH